MRRHRIKYAATRRKPAPTTPRRHLNYRAVPDETLLTGWFCYKILPGRLAKPTKQNDNNSH
jgi:hypothetical protein